MEPAETLALIVATVGAVYLAAGAVLDLVRLATRLRLGWLPSLQRTVAAAGMVLVVMRSTPAGAALPPPAIRLDPRPAAAAVAPTPEASPVTIVTGETYRVRAGDSLWAIAARRLGDAAAPEVDRYWRAIYAANRAVVGDDPDLIPGQVLALPAP